MMLTGSFGNLFPYWSWTERYCLQAADAAAKVKTLLLPLLLATPAPAPAVGAYLSKGKLLNCRGV